MSNEVVVIIKVATVSTCDKVNGGRKSARKHVPIGMNLYSLHKVEAKML